MGQDYNYRYTQPSSSEACGMYSLYSRQSDIEADIVEDQAQSNYNNAELIQYPPQPEVEFGFPKRCYCGGEPLLNRSYTRNDPGRRFYTCENRDDGDCHVWKWWDVAATEEIRALETMYVQLAEKVDCVAGSSDFQSEIAEIKFIHSETEEKLVEVQKIVGDLTKKKARLELVIGILAIGVALIGILLMF